MEITSNIENSKQQVGDISKDSKLINIDQFLVVPKTVVKKRRNIQSHVKDSDFVLTSDTYQKLKQNAINQKNEEAETIRKNKELRALKKIKNEELKQKKKEDRENKKIEKTLKTIKKEK
jgi:hypothetical protein